MGSPSRGRTNRQLTNLSGGDSSSHTDVHLWYHGTVDLVTPASDTGDTITAAERTAWWTAVEARGTNSGFLYSRIAGGSRFSTLEPAGAGKGRIVDGFNTYWNLGAGAMPNRTLLPANNALWPNLIRLNVTGTNRFTVSQTIPVAAYFQFGSNTSASAEVRFFLDTDLNPFNANQVELMATTLSGTGPTNVGAGTLSIVPDPMLTPPGTYGLLAKITYGTRSRLFYAPEPIILTPGTDRPVLLSPAYEAGAFKFTVAVSPWQNVAIEASTNLVNWIPLQTNRFPTNFPFSDAVTSPLRFYRAVLQP